jgi:hypothetical protein
MQIGFQLRAINVWRCLRSSRLKSTANVTALDNLLLEHVEALYQGMTSLRHVNVHTFTQVRLSEQVLVFENL